MASLVINRISDYNANLYEDILKETYHYMYPNFRHNYPGFKTWYFDKVIPGVYRGERILYVVQNEELSNIYGVSILKLSNNINKANKICSLYINPEVRREGVANKIMKYVAQDLVRYSPTSATAITVSETSLRENKFASFLSSFGLFISDAILSQYRTGFTEYIFRGNLKVSYGYSN